MRGSETPRRDVRLLDMRGAAAVVTLWGEAARSAGCWRALETDLLLVVSLLLEDLCQKLSHW